ncbi:hypothetical protein E2C01_085627 [Portunus trituberculatus]|uniref:Uncharacterized protein n=1 Tax=Portunus trituberculatus TaxID=210409 RepID=A0A5B7J1I8_PORTR|nr:hypothetical protein [Portunus trituberculatus]
MFQNTGLSAHLGSLPHGADEA